MGLAVPGGEDDPGEPPDHGGAPRPPVGGAGGDQMRVQASVSTVRRMASISSKCSWPQISGGASWMTGSPRSSQRQGSPASNSDGERKPRSNHSDSSSVNVSRVALSLTSSMP